MTSGKNLTSSGTEFRLHPNYFLLCHDILDTRDSHLAKVDVSCAFKNPSQVSDVDVAHHPYVRFTHGALERRRPETVPGMLTSSTYLINVDMSTL